MTVKKMNNCLAIIVFVSFFPLERVYSQSNSSGCDTESLSSDIENILLRPIDETMVTRHDGTEEKFIKVFRGTALIARHGKSIFRKSYGLADDKLLNESTNKYEIGSITKQFTAAAILKLHQRGKLNINDAVAKYLPGVPPEEKWQSLTIQDLLTHRSGQLGYYDNSIYPSGGSITLSQFVSLIFEKPLREAPGKYAQYSNLGYVLLSAIIEAVSRKTYEAFLRDEIFIPTGMSKTGIFQRKNPVDHLSQPHVIGVGNNGSYYFRTANPSDKSYMHGAGDMYSTVDDLLNWQSALLNYQILSPEMLKEMFAPRSLIGGETFGYGVQLSHSGNVTTIGHDGKTIGSTSTMEWSLDGETTLIILANADYYKLMTTIKTEIWAAISRRCSVPHDGSDQ